MKNKKRERALALACCAAMAAPVAPETTPAMSPMTSLQTDETFSVLEMSQTAFLPAFSLRAAIELKAVMSAVATARPMMSNTMPSETNRISTMIDANIGSVSMISPEARDSSAVMKKLASSTVSAQRRICRLRPFSFSFFRRNGPSDGFCINDKSPFRRQARGTKVDEIRLRRRSRQNRAEAHFQTEFAHKAGEL